MIGEKKKHVPGKVYIRYVCGKEPSGDTLKKGKI